LDKHGVIPLSRVCIGIENLVLQTNLHYHIKMMVKAFFICIDFYEYQGCTLQCPII